MRLRTGTLVVAALVIMLVLAGCESGVNLFTLGGRDFTRTAAEGVLTIDNIAQMRDQTRWLVSLGPVVATVYSPAEPHIATLGEDRIVRIWDANTGRLLDELFEHENLGFGLTYSPDGRYLLSAGGAVGQDTRVWDLRSKQQVMTTSTDGYYIFDVAWAPDEDGFAIVSNGSSRIYLYETRTYDRLQRRPSGIPLTAVAYSEKYLAVTNSIGSTYIYSYKEPELYALLREMRYDINVDRAVEDDVPGRDLEFSPGDELLANCYQDGVVEIWRTSDWEKVSTFKAHEFVKNRVLGCRDGAFTFGGDVYLTVGDDRFLRAWNPLTGEKIAEWEFPISVRTVAVSTGGDQIAVGTADGTLFIMGLPETPTSANR